MFGLSLIAPKENSCFSGDIYSLSPRGGSRVSPCRSEAAFTQRQCSPHNRINYLQKHCKWRFSSDRLHLNQTLKLEIDTAADEDGKAVHESCYTKQVADLCAILQRLRLLPPREFKLGNDSRNCSPFRAYLSGSNYI